MNDLYVHIFESYRVLLFWMRDFIEKNKADIDRVFRIEDRVLMKNGDEHKFVTWKRYEDWCKGRTYKKYGKEGTYHSDHRIE